LAVGLLNITRYVVATAELPTVYC